MLLPNIPWDVLFEKAGLALNFIGTVFVAKSVGKHPDNEAFTEDNKGNPVHFAYVTDPKGLQRGLRLIALGFLLQALPFFQYYL